MTDDTLSTQDDRREFFRIDDSILVSYRLLEKEEGDQAGQDPGLDGKFTIMTRLQSISQHLTASLRRIEQRDADIADYLKALDDKINMLGQAFLADKSDLLNQPTRPVNLSAGGIALDAKEALNPGDRVEIKLLLLPSYSGIEALGEVVDAVENKGDNDLPYRLHINFTAINEADRDVMIRHIMRRQSQMLRQKRIESENLAD